ncbi:hypothetical protein ACIF9R_35530 [Streptomyces sp. NPDC086080]
MTAHELGAIAKRHFTVPVLNRCGADVVNYGTGVGAGSPEFSLVA